MHAPEPRAHLLHPLMPREAQPRASPGGCRDPQHFIILIKLTWGSLSGIATCLAFLPCSWQTQDCLCMGKGKEWINYLQRVHDLSHFPWSISSEQVRCSAPAGFRGGPVSANGRRTLGLFQGRFSCGSLGRELGGLCRVHLLLFCVSLQEESRGQRQPAPSPRMSHQHDSAGFGWALGQGCSAGGSRAFHVPHFRATIITWVSWFIVPLK